MPIHVVTLDGEHLFQQMSRAISLRAQTPSTQTLAAMLGFTTQRLLRDEE